MSLFFASLLQPTDAYDVEVIPEGFVLQSKAGAQSAFDEVARRAINHDGTQFAVFPTPNGVGGYESILIIPIAC